MTWVWHEWLHRMLLTEGINSNVNLKRCRCHHSIWTLSRRETWLGLTLWRSTRSSRGRSSWNTVGYTRNRLDGHIGSRVSLAPGSSDTHSSVREPLQHLHRKHTSVKQTGSVVGKVEPNQRQPWHLLVKSMNWNKCPTLPILIRPMTSHMTFPTGRAATHRLKDDI